jgi:predicted alpha/beta-fold hydrolase
MRLSISFALLLLWQLTLQFLILCSVECTPFGGNFIPLPTLTGQLPDISEIQQTAMNAIDDMTVQSLNLIMGSKSYQIPLPSNQSVHAIEFKGYGNLPPIVLLHGITSCASDYYPLIRQLQTKCSRVVAIDLPGHGKTVSDPNQGLKKLEGLMIESVRSAICTLDTRNCILVGNSLGGFVASR